MKSLYVTLAIIIIVLVAGWFMMKNRPAQPEDQTPLPQESLPGGVAQKMRPEALTNAQAMVLGVWVSDTDPKYVVEFTADKKIDTYNNKEQSRDAYVLMPQAGDAGFEITVTDAENPVPAVYTVVENTDTKLVISLVGGNGQSLSFTKKVQ